jgi:TetR/AcrR family transcriptional regulator, transcriptional repressor for nem operon
MTVFSSLCVQTVCQPGALAAAKILSHNPFKPIPAIKSIDGLVARFRQSEGFEILGRPGLAEPPMLWKPPLSGRSAHGLTCCRLDPVANDPHSCHLQFKTDWSIFMIMTHPTPRQLPRGRPRSFDTEAVVERAMGVFWSRGYRGTALPDLLRATKLSRGSLYAAFGGKHALFLRALDRYIADALARIDVELGPRHAPVESLRTFLAGYVDRTSGASGRRGCLLVATAMELAGHDSDVEARIGSFFKAMEAKAAGALSRAKVAGELAAGVEPASAARILVCFVEGLRVIGKTGPTRTTSQATVDALLDRFIR